MIGELRGEALADALRTGGCGAIVVAAR
jgi:hypothetical protein